MRVVCINDSGWEDTIPVKVKTPYFFGLFTKVTMENPETRGPSVGDICTVVGQEDLGDGIYYQLAEWPDDETFESDCFVPIEESKSSEYKATSFVKIIETVPACDN